jgi:hypothetical protein
VRITRGRVGTMTLVIFMLSLALFPPTSSAQSDVYYPDYNLGGGGAITGGGGSCDYCGQPQCGCDPGTFSIGVVLVQWVCICDSQPHGICMQTCWYATY